MRLFSLYILEGALAGRSILIAHNDEGWVTSVVFVQILEGAVCFTSVSASIELESK